ncbi:hypothetical protein Ahy_A09g042185 [Arachis hypogaea]|uniref:Uncharacterized protein n=1 Tax=Arachis hypogaea TaxID=3818 RepID=A0A445BF20_ARAHY|nr:hypothetical protein Ahy_A09g042185 [Arachis hypogaea]
MLLFLLLKPNSNSDDLIVFPIQTTMAVNLNHTILCLALTLTAATFDQEIGAEYAQQTLIAATNFIDRLFGLNSNLAAVNKVSITVENIDGVAFTTSDNNIHGTLKRYPAGGRYIKREITVVICHKMAHILLSDGSDRARLPSGLVEGMADFVRLRADYAADSWDDVAGFVADLNKLMMQNGYSKSYLVLLLGKPVSQLWIEYKALYDLNN